MTEAVSFPKFMNNIGVFLTSFEFSGRGRFHAYKTSKKLNENNLSPYIKIGKKKLMK